jgi:16S rRNA (adenine1518-N6/adenine1519-N6)-dimethyltransferase
MILSKASLFRPRKSWGQHFLIDNNIARKIVDLAHIVSGDDIVEIGPGKGVLTGLLLERGSRVLAIEIDPQLTDLLHKTFPPPLPFELVCMDACRYPYANINAPYKVVANLPYNISTPLLFRLIEEGRCLTEMVLMVQKEVADRLAAPVGTKQYGSLSVLFQSWADIKVAFTVPPQCFRPRPKVSSAVIKVTLSKNKNIPLKDNNFFVKVVKASFSHRRKFLINALTDAGFAHDIVSETLYKIGIDPQARAETLSLHAFAHLANGLFNIT